MRYHTILSRILTQEGKEIKIEIEIPRIRTTEELEKILRLDAQAPEEQKSDTKTLLYIMGC